MAYKQEPGRGPTAVFKSLKSKVTDEIRKAKKN